MASSLFRFNFAQRVLVVGAAMPHHKINARFLRLARFVGMCPFAIVRDAE